MHKKIEKQHQYEENNQAEKHAETLIEDSNITKVIISWSSGKDSTLCLLRLLDNPNFEVVALFTTYFQQQVPFQYTPLEIVQAQADKIGLPLITLELPQVFPENAVYQQLVVTKLRQCGIDFSAVAFGDMFCNGIAEYRKSYIEPAGWQCVFPLSGEQPQQLAEEIIQRNIRCFVCTVDTQQLDGKFVGHNYDHQLLQQLPLETDKCGENGEFHTFVYDTPCFSSPLSLQLNEIDRSERFHFQKYQLVRKNAS